MAIRAIGEDPSIGSLEIAARTAIDNVNNRLKDRLSDHQLDLNGDLIRYIELIGYSPKRGGVVVACEWNSGLTVDAIDTVEITLVELNYGYANSVEGSDYKFQIVFPDLDEFSECCEDVSMPILGTPKPHNPGTVLAPELLRAASNQVRMANSGIESQMDISDAIEFVGISKDRCTYGYPIVICKWADGLGDLENLTFIKEALIKEGYTIYLSDEDPSQLSGIVLDLNQFIKEPGSPEVRPEIGAVSRGIWAKIASIFRGKRGRDE